MKLTKQTNIIQKSHTNTHNENQRVKYTIFYFTLLLSIDLQTVFSIHYSLPPKYSICVTNLLSFYAEKSMPFTEQEKTKTQKAKNLEENRIKASEGIQFAANLF